MHENWSNELNKMNGSLSEIVRFYTGHIKFIGTLFLYYDADAFTIVILNINFRFVWTLYWIWVSKILLFSLSLFIQIELFEYMC